MQLTYDEIADAAYVYFTQAPVSSTEELASGVLVDYDKDGVAVGVEFLDVSDGIDLSEVPRRDEITSLLANHPSKFPTFA